MLPLGLGVDAELLSIRMYNLLVMETFVSREVAGRRLI